MIIDDTIDIFLFSNFIVSGVAIIFPVKFVGILGRENFVTTHTFYKFSLIEKLVYAVLTIGSIAYVRTFRFWLDCSAIITYKIFSMEAISA